MSLIDYAAQLNTQQLEAVTAPPGPILVIAGAGSGKTRTLTYRVSYLLEHGNEPQHILLLTFTNKAAREMLERVRELIPRDLTRLWGGTFHHIGNRILRQHATRLGYQKSFSIMDRDDAVSLLKSCFETEGINPKDKRFPKPEVVLEVLSIATNKEQNTQNAISTSFSHLREFTDSIMRLHVAYQNKKRESNVVDYDDLLILPLRICREHPEILEQYQNQFEHILVDEYQDTNRIQAGWIDLLGTKHHNIMAVGDDAQSIYSWRGADFSNILTFPERHRGCRLIRLEMNYRSIPEILQVANHAIAQNTQQFPKNLTAQRSPGIKPALVTFDDSRQQASFIAERIRELVQEGISPHEIAILYRAHFHSMELQMELTRRQIPFFITSGLRFFEQAHIKDVAALLRFLVNPKDEVSFRRVLFLLPGAGEKTVSKAWTALQAGAAWNEIPLPEKTRLPWKAWEDLNNQLRARDAQYFPAELLRSIIDDFYSDYLRLFYDNYTQRLEDLQQLQAFAQSFEETDEFLSQLALMSNVEADTTVPRPQKAVQLSTIHQAKGLEYKVVFLIMLCDGMFPSSRAIETLAGEEEERRLFYVGLTRAKDELYLTYPKRRAFAGQGDMYQAPSRFLSDFPKELCNSWRIQTSDPSSSSFSSKSRSFSKRYTSSFKSIQDNIEDESFSRPPHWDHFDDSTPSSLSQKSKIEKQPPSLSTHKPAYTPHHIGKWKKKTESVENEVDPLHSLDDPF